MPLSRISVATSTATVTQGASTSFPEANLNLAPLPPNLVAPEVHMPEGWNAIPGARGCSRHNCDMRKHHADMTQNGVSRVYGLSSQPREYQDALAKALRLPYPLMTDPEMVLASILNLPTIHAGDLTAYQRLALIINDGTVEHVFFPVFPPDHHAQVVLDWLSKNPESRNS
jgi:peroxiredoxin